MDTLGGLGAERLFIPQPLLWDAHEGFHLEHPTFPRWRVRRCEVGGSHFVRTSLGGSAFVKRTACYEATTGASVV